MSSYDYHLSPVLSPEQEETARALARKLKQIMKDSKIQVKMVLNKPAMEAVDICLTIPQKKDPNRHITIQRTKVRTAENSVQVISLMPILE